MADELLAATLTVYVPASENTHGIKPGSAIVGSPESRSDRIRVDYEGGLYMGEYFAEYETRLLHAAGRHIANGGRGYPTIARAWLKDTELHAVGTYACDFLQREYRLNVTDPEALDAWINMWRPN